MILNKLKLWGDEMAEIRGLKEQDIDQCLDLSMFAFQYELSEEERKEKRSKLKLVEYWGFYDSGNLAAKMRIIPLNLFIQGQIFKMGGIASVATWPEYRRQGIVGKLLVHALNEMKRQGRLISVLHPFSFDFYRRYGWETNTEYKLYTIERSQLPVIKDSEGTFKRVSDPEKHWEIFHQIYLNYASGYNGMLQRDKNWWREIVFVTKKGTSVICYDQNGEPSGYILYSVKNKEMIIKEMVYIHEAARKSLWKFIADHDSMVERISFIAPPADPTAFLLPDPRIKQEIKPYSMARIVDVKAFLELFPFKPTGGELHFTMDLSDEHAEWNHGSFAVLINKEGKATVKKINQYEDTLDKSAKMNSNFSKITRISCDIQSLSAIMTGYQSPIDMHAFGRLSGDFELIKRLDSAMRDRDRERGVYLTDFF